MDTVLEYMLIASTTFVASFISFYSGFGLATLLMPVIAIFLPLPLAIAVTAAVHLLHNILKSALLWKYVTWKVVRQFGSTAILTAVFGALLLKELSELPTLKEYSILGLQGTISWLHLLIGLLLIAFATIEALGVKKIQIHNLYLGGALGGFLGGLSGNQGALRSLFLLHANLNAESFIATNAAIAVVVDATRLFVYGISFHQLIQSASISLIATCMASSICGIILGMSFLKKIDLHFVQKIIITLLYIFGILFVLGLIL